LTTKLFIHKLKKIRRFYQVMVKKFLRVDLAFIAASLLALAIVVFAGTFNCQFGSNKGTVDALTIDLGTILWADGNGGKSTNVSLPTKFDHSGGTTSKDDIPTSYGNFKLQLTAKLAGNKTLGIWRSKRNVLKVEVHDGSMSGEVLAEGTLDKNVSSPSNYTLTLPQVTANLESGESKRYAIKIIFDKYDDDGNDDGYCGMTIGVRAK